MSDPIPISTLLSTHAATHNVKKMVDHTCIETISIYLLEVFLSSLQNPI